MPLIQNSPNKRFGLSRSWTQKNLCKTERTSFWFGKGLCQMDWTFFWIRKGLRLTEAPSFWFEKGLCQMDWTFFLNQKRLAPNGGTLFLNQKRLVQNEGNVYGVKKWRLYLYRYPIWRTASSTADWSAARWTKKTYSSACVSIKPSFKSCLLSAAS